MFSTRPLILPDMVAHVFIFEAFAPLFCLKAVIYQCCTDKKICVFKGYFKNSWCSKGVTSVWD